MEKVNEKIIAYQLEDYLNLAVEINNAPSLTLQYMNDPLLVALIPRESFDLKNLASMIYVSTQALRAIEHRIIQGEGGFKVELL